MTYRSNGFVMMLVPLRDLLHSKDPMSPPLLSTAKECYLMRLSTGTDSDESGYGESRWIASEGADIESLPDVFTSLDPSSEIAWDACAGFLYHLHWHKPPLTMLGPKIETLPDNHPSKTQCLRAFGFLLNSVGNGAESERL